MITENNIKHKNDDFLKKKSPQKHRSSINSTELPEFSESNENSKLKNSIPDLLDMSLSDLTDCDEKKLFKKNVQTSIQLTPYEESLYLKPEFLIDLIKTINAMKNTLKPNKNSLKEILMSKKCREVEFFSDPEIPSSINTQTFIDQQEWKLYNHVEVSKKDLYRVIFKEKAPVIRFTCHACRRPGYFYWNIYLLIVCIISNFLSIDYCNLYLN